MPVLLEILEMYFPKSATFFTPVGELGLALLLTWKGYTNSGFFAIAAGDVGVEQIHIEEPLSIVESLVLEMAPNIGLPAGMEAAEMVSDPSSKDTLALT